MKDVPSTKNLAPFRYLSKYKSKFFNNNIQEIWQNNVSIPTESERSHDDSKL